MQQLNLGNGPVPQVSEHTSWYKKQLRNSQNHTPAALPDFPEHASIHSFSKMLRLLVHDLWMQLHADRWKQADSL